MQCDMNFQWHRQSLQVHAIYRVNYTHCLKKCPGAAVTQTNTDCQSVSIQDMTSVHSPMQHDSVGETNRAVCVRDNKRDRGWHTGHMP